MGPILFFYRSCIIVMIISLRDSGHITSVKLTSQYGITMKRSSPLTHLFNLAHSSQNVELRLSFMTVNALECSAPIKKKKTYR